MRDEPAREHQRGRARPLEGARHGDRVIDVQPSRDTVIKVRLGEDRSLRTDGFAYRAHHLEREAHAVLERPAVGVAATIAMRAEELAEEVAMAEMHLDRVEAGHEGTARSTNEVPLGPFEILGAHRAREGHALQGTIGVERERRTEGALPTETFVLAEATTVPHLEHRGGPFAVYGLGDAAQRADRVVAHHHLVGERAPLGRDRAVGHRGHAHAAARQLDVVALQHLAGEAAHDHALVGGGLDDPVAQGEPPEAERLENGMARR